MPVEVEVAVSDVEEDKPKAKKSKKDKKEKKKEVVKEEISEEEEKVEKKKKKKDKKKEKEEKKSKKRKAVEESEDEKEEEAPAEENTAEEAAEVDVEEKRPAKKARIDKDAANGDGGDGGYNSGGGTAAKAFQRVKADEWLGKKGSWDNSYVGTFGENGWGFKAQQILGQVKGKDFRHEKTKKKRGSYRGGVIDTDARCSFKFESDDE